MNISILPIAFAFAAALSVAPAQAAKPLRGNAPPTTAALERSLQRQLNRHLSFPLMEKGDMTGKVHVSFNIDTDGRVQVIHCSSANERLRLYVLRKLARIDIGSNPDGSWKTTHLVIDFRPERRS